MAVSVVRYVPWHRWCRSRANDNDNRCAFCQFLFQEPPSYAGEALSVLAVMDNLRDY